MPKPKAKPVVSQRVIAAVNALAQDEEFVAVASGASAPTEADVAAFEEEVGVRFPSDFRALAMSVAAGLFVEVNKKIWPPAKLYDTGPFWSFLNGVYVFGLAKNIPEDLDMRIEHANLVSRGHHLVPLMAVAGNADRWCLDAKGALVHWDHETGLTEKVSLSFDDLLLRELDELRARKEKKVKLLAEQKAAHKKPAKKKPAPARKKAGPKKKARR